MFFAHCQGKIMHRISSYKQSLVKHQFPRQNSAEISRHPPGQHTGEMHNGVHRVKYRDAIGIIVRSAPM